MNYCKAIRDALVVFDENHAASWAALTEEDLKAKAKPSTSMAVVRRLMGCTSVRPRTGQLGVTLTKGYVFHKDRWRRVVKCKNGKHRLEGAL